MFAMPILEFACPACGATFERLFRSMAGPSSPPACPACGSPTERKLSTFAASVAPEAPAAGPCGRPQCDSA